VFKHTVEDVLAMVCGDSIPAISSSSNVLIQSHLPVYMCMQSTIIRTYATKTDQANQK